RAVAARRRAERQSQIAEDEARKAEDARRVAERERSRADLALREAERERDQANRAKQRLADQLKKEQARLKRLRAKVGETGDGTID
ncbi:MAG: Uma2 family endonuclease, partial [Myxococcota bacterium]